MLIIREHKVAKDSVRRKVHDILENYLEANGQRKTPERFALLDAVYSIDGHFSIDDLAHYMENGNFRVSRATLYNTMKLFLELRLVVRHRFIGETKYEACFKNKDHIHQVCTICGTVKEVNLPAVVESIEASKLHRFRKDGFSLYIYGVCSTCQSRLTRMRNKLK